MRGLGRRTASALGRALGPLLRLAAGVGIGVAGPSGQAQPAAPPPPPLTVPVPAPLRCLERYYGVRAELVADRPGAQPRWYARLPDGQRLLYDDGRDKPPPQRLDEADLEDMFSQRYPTGPIGPVTTVDQDPGRYRVDALFQARYGATPREIPVVPFVLFGTRLKVHRLVEPVFARVRQRLEALVAAQPLLRSYFARMGGTLVFRNIAGTSRRSAHSYGVSLDINVGRSHYWRWQRPRTPLRWQNDIPQPIVDAFEAEGFIWGGRWYHYDTMHFEYRPELLDPACYPAAAR
ncbi:MAG: M15 family metallopeptidase [Polyangia bacterium]